MLRHQVSSWILLAFALGVCHAQPAPQRTMSAAPSKAAATPDSTDDAIRQYRQMWQKMSPAQQKSFLDSGGSTPEQYERTLHTKGVATAPSTRPAPADPATPANALDSVMGSMQDLNAIRDANLLRVQKDGCPPEVTSRLADLRGRLRQLESGTDAPPSKPRPGASDPSSVAADWYKHAAPETSAKPAADTPQNKQLDDVLPAAPAKPAEKPAPPAAAPQDIEQIRAEIAQLSGACAAVKR